MSLTVAPSSETARPSAARDVEPISCSRASTAHCIGFSPSPIRLVKTAVWRWLTCRST